MCRWISTVVAAHLLSLCAAYNSRQRGIYTPYKEELQCRDLKAQNALDIDSVTGIWFGIELILHKKYEQGVEIADTCVVFHIAETTYEVGTLEVLNIGEE